MAKDIIFKYEDHEISVEKLTLDDLICSGTEVAFNGVVSSIRQAINKQWHFVIIAEDGTTISRRFDRIGDFEKFVEDAEKVRAEIQTRNS